MFRSSLHFIFCLENRSFFLSRAQSDPISLTMVRRSLLSIYLFISEENTTYSLNSDSHKFYENILTWKIFFEKLLESIKEIKKCLYHIFKKEEF